eukprot:scaffold48465_cov61-Phaeocystis_antarctica.AAC.2
MALATAIVYGASALLVGSVGGARSISTSACGVRVFMVSRSGHASMTTTADEVRGCTVPCQPWPCRACLHPTLLAAEDSLPDDLLAAMDAAAELQSDAAQPGSDAEQLDVAALRQSLVDLTRLGSSEQQGPGAKADAQRWKEVFGSDTAWSKCPRPQQQITRPPTRSRSPPACSGLPSNPKRRAVTAWPLKRAL